MTAPFNRRQFLAAAAAAASAAGVFVGPHRATAATPELKITRIVLQTAKGRRATPVAPNAYAPYRGYDVSEPMVRIETAQGMHGVASAARAKPEVLKALLGLDPFSLFDWNGDVVSNVRERHARLLDDLGGADVALFDLMGQATRRPVADLLGKTLNDAVKVYDSSLYMEDLLTPEERRDLPYVHGPVPDDPAELVALKAAWALGRPGKLKIFKIKIGRAKWMKSAAASLDRDVEVVKAVRRAVGKDVVLLVDGNNDYKAHPDLAAEFARRTADDRLYAMEEMIPEQMIEETREIKRRVRAAGLTLKLADGETERGGIADALKAERFAAPGSPVEPLFDIENADVNANGFLRLREIARRCEANGMTIAPHNFGSKIGLYAAVHLGSVTPNWEFAESDDSAFPALTADGIVLRNGVAELTGTPGLGVTLHEQHLEKPTLVLEA